MLIGVKILAARHNNPTSTSGITGHTRLKLTSRQVAVLARIEHEPGITGAQIQRRLPRRCVTLNNIYRLLRLYVQHGLVRRLRPYKKRGTICIPHKLTAAGRRLLQQHLRDMVGEV